MKIDSKVCIAFLVFLSSACMHGRNASSGASAYAPTDVRINPGIPPEFWQTPPAKVYTPPIKAGQLLHIPASEKALKSADLRGTGKGKKKQATAGSKGRREQLYTQHRQFAWPVEGKVGSKFGPRNGRPHAGIDILSDSGEPILAAHAGKVEFAGWKRGYGLTVIIRHDGYKTLYAHCAKILAKVGDDVTKGQKVAVVGDSGNADGIHLHFEYHTLAGKALDPMPHFARALAH